MRHTARNNLSADERAHVQGIGAAIAQINARIEAGHTAHHTFGSAPARNLSGAANASDEPLYQCTITAQRAAVPVRIGALDARGLPDPRLHARPSVQGVQTAIVVGLAGQPIHTDRDQRIKVQFHWQRGANASHRLDLDSARLALRQMQAIDTLRVQLQATGTLRGAGHDTTFPGARSGNCKQQPPSLRPPAEGLQGHGRAAVLAGKSVPEVASSRAAARMPVRAPRHVRVVKR